MEKITAQITNVIETVSKLGIGLIALGIIAEIIFGHLVDDSLGDAVEVTVVAAGFGQRPTRRVSSDFDENGGESLPDFIRG